ncbi:MAG: S-layer homology domain-containing protein [Bacillota bacterium]
MVRKLAVVVLAVAMLMSCMGLASAAKFPDTAGHKQEAAIDRIASLGLVKGYPDGTFKPDAPITRAEFAKVMVCALGLETAAEMMATTPTVFADVPVGYWATGYINVAASQGIVNGYPDGTFQPNNNVTYAEALKMILCALGYKPEVFRTIVWPVTWVAKAMELGITGGVTLATGAASLPATRADIARLVDNALDEPMLEQVGYGDEITYKVGDKTLLGNLGATPIEGRVADVGTLLGSALDDNEIALADGSKYTVAEGIDVSNLYGLKIKAWVNADDEIVVITSTDESSVQTKNLMEISRTGAGTSTDPYVYKAKVGTSSDYKIYTFKSDALVFGDFQKASLANWLGTYSGDAEAQYILDDDNYIVAFRVVKWDGSSVVNSVNEKYEKVTFKPSGALNLKDKDYTIVRDGAVVELGDIQENDVLYSFNNGDEYRVIVLSAKVVGTVESSAMDGSYFYLDGTKYKRSTDGYTFSTDGGDDVDDTAGISDFLGEETTVVLDHFGKARFVYADVTGAAEPTKYALAYDAKTVLGLSDVTYLRVFGSDGENVDYALKKGTKVTDTTGAEHTFDPALHAEADVRGWLGITKGNYDTLVAFKLDSNGKLASVKPLAATSEGTVTPDKDNNLIKVVEVGATVIYGLTDSTIFFDISDVTDPALGSWSAAKATGDFGGWVYAASKGGDAIVVVNTDDSKPFVMDTVAGALVDKYYVADGLRLMMDINGESKSYTFDPGDFDPVLLVGNNSDSGTTVSDWVYAEIGEILELTFNASGDVSGVKESEATDSGLTVDSVSLSAKRIKATKSGTTYTFYADSKTQVYDVTGDPVNVGLEGLTAGDTIRVFVGGDGYLDFVVIYTPE